MIKKILPYLIEASDKINKHFHEISNVKITSKEGMGVLTQADLESEEILLNGLNKEFPNDEILSEEKFYFDKKSIDNFSRNNLWLVDPIDGTNNFLSGFDHFAISIAYLENGHLKFGAVYQPLRSRLYWAQRGEGAFFHDLSANDSQRALRGSNILKKKNELSLITSMCKLVENKYKLEQLYQFNENVRSVRRLGSAALDLCFVADGVFDGFYDDGLMPWDIAAGALIAKEAGLEIRNYKGAEFDVFGQGIITAKKNDIELFKSILDN